MDIIAPNRIERAFLSRLAAPLQMTVDGELFPGMIPMTKTDRKGAALRLSGEEMISGPHAPRLLFELRIVDPDRVRLLETVFRVRNAFPQRRITVALEAEEAVFFQEIELTALRVSRQSEQGRIVHVGEMDFRVLL